MPEIGRGSFMAFAASFTIPAKPVDHPPTLPTIRFSRLGIMATWSPLTWKLANRVR